MSPHTDTVLRAFPSRIAELGFSAQLPPGWISHPLPDEVPDFSSPTTFFPLAIVTAPHAAMVFAFSARPAYEDGTLFDWAQYLVRENGLQVRAMGVQGVGAMQAFAGEAVQDSDLGPMVVRFAFCEDGGRLLNLTFTAPEQLDPAVRGFWFKMIESFALETPKGMTAALQPAPEPLRREPEPEPDMGSQATEPVHTRKPSSKSRRLAAIAASRGGSEPPGDTPGEPPVFLREDEREGFREPDEGSAPSPEWRKEAAELEMIGEIEAAERVILNNVQHLGAYASVAEMHRRRAVRLRDEGDTAGSQAAAKKAEHWIYSYAAGATSGGEGAALSLQRDEFLELLKGLLPEE